MEREMAVSPPRRCLGTHAVAFVQDQNSLRLRSIQSVGRSSQGSFLCLEEASSLVQLGPSSWRELEPFFHFRNHLSDLETYQVVSGYNLWAIDFGGSSGLEE